MHGVELVGLGLDAPARQFTFDRDGLKAALSKLRLQRLFLDARHWSATSWPPNLRASYRRQAPVLNGERTRSRYEPDASPSVFLPVATREYSSESFCCLVVGRLAASCRWRHSWQHAIESHAARDGGFIPGGRRSRVLSQSHSGTLDIRSAVCCGRERRRKIVLATRAAERPFQRAQTIGRRGAGPAFCSHLS